jgi:hypothetical protein
VGEKASKSGRQVSGGAGCGKGKQKIEGNKVEAFLYVVLVKDYV